MAVKYLDERTYETGGIIFSEGDIGTEMFIVTAGKVAVTKSLNHSETLLAVFERGDFFGEMALFDSQPRYGTCTALEPTRLVAIKSGELLGKLRRDPTFALEMLQAMSKRIRLLDEQVTELMKSEAASANALKKMRGKSEYLSRTRDR